MTKRLLVPVDGAEGGEAVLAAAADLALRFDAAVHALYVVESPARFYAPGAAFDELLADTRDWGGEVLVQAAAALKARGVNRVETHLEEGHPAQVILERAKAWQVDLIVMGTHGRRGLNRLLLGSIAEEVVRCSPIPVLTVRARPASG